MTHTRRGRAGRLVAAALPATLLAICVAASPAVAADEVSIDHVESNNGVVSMVVSVDGVPGDSVGSSDVTVQVNGKAVDAQTEPVAGGDVARSTILVVDASNSMRGAKFASATDAVTAFLATAPPDVQIGMVAFAGETTAAIEPTADRTALLDDFRNLTLGLGTSVYDAVGEATALLGTEGSRSLLLISDGADTGSSATLEDIAAEAAENEVVIDVVSIGSAARADQLTTLAEQTNGQVFPADAAALSGVLAEQATALAQQLLVKVELPEGISDDVDLDVTVNGVGTTFTDSATINVGERQPTGTGPVSSVVTKPLVGNTLMLVGAGILFLGLLLAGSLAVVGRTGREAAVKKRLDAYFGEDVKTKSRQAFEGASVKESAVKFTDQFVSRDFETKLSQRLAGAGSGMTAAEWLLMHAAVAVVSGLVGFLLFGGLLGFIFLILGAIAPWAVIRAKHRRRLAAFNGQLAETLDMISGGLQAGLSLPQAVDTVVQQGQEPMAPELRRALAEQRLGVDITDALEGVGERMESADFAWVVMAMRIQREVGGNLAEILRTVSDTMREREYLRRQVRSLSAEGRISGYILTALPILVFVYMTMVNREYVATLWTTFIGWMLLGLATVLLLLGGYMMKKLAVVEV